MVKSRQYDYAASSLEGEGETVSQIFQHKNRLRKIDPKAAMETVEEQPVFKAEPAYVVKNKGTNIISRLLSAEDEEAETPRYVSVRGGFGVKNSRSK